MYICYMALFIPIIVSNNNFLARYALNYIKEEQQV